GYFREYSQNGELLNTNKYQDGELIQDPEEFTDIEIVKEYYPGAKIKSELTYVNGIPNGIYREYSIDGKITGSKIYKDGIVSGEGIIDKKGKKQDVWKEYYPFDNDKHVGTSRLKAEGMYKNNKRTGEWIFYHENGVIEQKGKYVKGRPDEIWKWYYESGNLLREEHFERGIENGYLIEYSDSGTIITKGEFIDGDKEGLWFYEVGDHREEGVYKNGKREGIWRYYYDNGELSFEGEFIDGNPNENHRYYYKDGKIKEEGTFIMGNKEGVWKNYNEDGIISLIITYKDGVEVKYDGVKIKPVTEKIEN
ncbi:toxin-antitoxin system YwqK family antitoxin, partial [bacterium AH-315-M05]|nr:toxin-antitoxin system YwqK family antitoxin [bacterium AH-315-M05]